MLYHELIPARDKDSNKVLVVLHGLGDSIEGYRWLPQELNLPYLNYILVNAPDPYYDGYSWFNIGESLVDPKGVVRSRKLLFELLDSLPERGFPAQQTAVFGFSQGCLMVWEIGLRYPRVLAGLIGISGWAFEEGGLIKEMSSVAKQQKFLITHGYYDPLLPFSQVKEQVKRFINLGLSIEWYEFAKQHTIAGEEEITVIRNFLNKVFCKELEVK